MTKENGIEVWKELTGMPTRYRYEVSNQGHVRYSRDDDKTVRYCTISTIKGHGYSFVDVELRGYRSKSGNPKKRRIYLHRLVWLVFHGAIDMTKWIKHKNDDRTDNRLDNLECLPKVQARGYHGGEMHHAAKLSWSDIEEMKSLRSAGISYCELAKRYGVAECTARKAVIGLAWVRPDMKMVRDQEQARCTTTSNV